MAGTSTYVGILVVIIAAVFAIYIMLSNGSINHASTTSTITTTVNSIATENVSSTTTIKTNQTHSCESNESTVSIYNGNFSTGTFFGWTTYGKGFGTAPLNLTYANNKNDYYVDQWSGYNSNSNYAATTFRNGASPVPGNISLTYVPILPYLNFQIFSPPSPELYVELIPSNGPATIMHYNTLNGTRNDTLNEFADASINVTRLMCQSVTVRIVANVSMSASQAGTVSSNQNLYMAVGGFYQSSQPSETSGINVTD